MPSFIQKTMEFFYLCAPYLAAGLVGLGIIAITINFIIKSRQKSKEQKENEKQRKQKLKDYNKIK